MPAAPTRLASLSMCGITLVNMDKMRQFSRSHWKKLVFVSIAVTYGLNYIKDEYDNARHMRNVCNVVKQYTPDNRRKVLVVLNPIANRKKSEKQFQKYCEPVLHMAGYEVEIIKTEGIGHAKSLMEELKDLPDILVVAGGDGTSSEVVTGLIRRNEEICPILFLPLGENSETALNLMRLKDKRGIAKNLSHCMLALMQGHIQHRPLIKYELMENHNNKYNRPIFGIHAFSWGVLKDIEISTAKYWYFGSLKYYVALIIAALNNELNHNIIASIVSSPPCPGCNKCQTLVSNKSWLNKYKWLNQNRSSFHVNDNQLCATEREYKVNAKQIDIKCMKNSESYFALNTQITNKFPSQFDFIINALKENKILCSNSFDSRTMEIIPKSQNQTYYIDGENYDARHIKISFLPNSLKYYYSSS